MSTIEVLQDLVVGWRHTSLRQPDFAPHPAHFVWTGEPLQPVHVQRIPFPSNPRMTEKVRDILQHNCNDLKKSCFLISTESGSPPYIPGQQVMAAFPW